MEKNWTYYHFVAAILLSAADSDFSIESVELDFIGDKISRRIGSEEEAVHVIKDSLAFVQETSEMERVDFFNNSIDTFFKTQKEQEQVLKDVKELIEVDENIELEELSFLEKIKTIV